MSSHSYTWEKLYLSVLCLATGKGGIKERLEDACTSQLMRLFHPADEIPAEYRERILAIEKAITVKAPRNQSEGAIHSTIQQMSESECSKLAEEIVNLYNEVLEDKTMAQARS